MSIPYLKYIFKYIACVHSLFLKYNTIIICFEKCLFKLLKLNVNYYLYVYLVCVYMVVLVVVMLSNKYNEKRCVYLQNVINNKHSEIKYLEYIKP